MKLNRRNFMVLVAAATTWRPVGTRAEQKMPVIGFLASTRAQDWSVFVKAFRQGLSSKGYVEGRNVTIEYRWAEDRYDRLPDLAADLIRMKVDVIVASGGDVAATAAKAMTATIPIVSTFGGDPVRTRLVKSFNRPGENVTGVSLFNLPLEAKRLELMHELLPRVKVLGQLVNGENPNSESEVQVVQSRARALGLEVRALRASDERGFGAAFADLARLNAGALLISSDPGFFTGSQKLVALAAQYGVPTIYYRREFVDAGGLLSYGSRYPDAYRQVGIYTGEVLGGRSAADIPVAQPTRFELVVNFKTAAAIGLTIPPTVMLRADEVIE